VGIRAGSSIRGSGGSLHPVALIIVHPVYDYNTLDFDVAVVRVSDDVFANLTLTKPI
jgi:trypsin